MPAKKLSDEELHEAVQAYQIHGTKAEAARQLGLSSSTYSDRLKVAEDRLGLDTQKPLVSEGSVARPKPRTLKLPRKGKIKRYILTSAQNNTRIHIPVWHNLLAMAEHYDAEVMVGTFTYNKAAYGSKSVKRGTKKSSDTDDMWYDPELQAYIRDEPLELAPGLIWCGELNTLPTAVRPLSSLESYTGRASGIFPHAKFEMESVVSGKYEATKFNYTTGVVTRRNYIQKKAGLKAEILHSYGALLAEVLPDGSWFVRQLAAGPDGSIQDLTVKAEGAEVTTGHQVEAINWGDIHKRALSNEMEALCWGSADSMLDTLRPKYQFGHDVLDFFNRNHHDRKKPHRMFDRFARKAEDVREEIFESAAFLSRTSRPWCQTIVVDSNHDSAIAKWLEETTHLEDPLNAIFYLEASLALYKAMEAGDRDFHVFEWSCEQSGEDLSQVRFLRSDESFIICQEYEEGIECGMHGHLGPNGARGAPSQFAKMARRSNTGHSHSAGIRGNNYCAGVTADEDLGYNVGPSSWSNSHIVTYPDGTRAIVTVWNGRWKA